MPSCRADRGPAHSPCRVLARALMLAHAALLAALAGLPGAAAAVVDIEAGSDARRTRPLDFGYLRHGASALVLDVFDDGEAVHVQPAEGVRLALRGTGFAVGRRGPYLVVSGLPDRFVLADTTDAAQTVEIVHRRRAGRNAEPPSPAAVSVGREPGVPSIGEAALPADEPGGPGEVAEPVVPAVAGESGPEPRAPAVARVSAVPAFAARALRFPSGRSGVDRGAIDGLVEPDPHLQSSGYAPDLQGRQVQSPSIRSGDPAAASTSALEFPAQASVQHTLRHWLARRGIEVEFVGVPSLRVEEAAVVDRGELYDTVGEALGRLGLRGVWTGGRLRVLPGEGAR